MNKQRDAVHGRQRWHWWFGYPLLIIGVTAPVQFICGNGELAVLAQGAASESKPVTYWGTVSGEPLPEPFPEVLRWTARQLRPEHEEVLRAWPATLAIDSPGDGPGALLPWHATQRS